MIKERIIQLIEYNNIPKEEFYKKIGITSANFRGNAKKTPLNSNTIENIITIMPDINLEWLLTGKGNMLKNKDVEVCSDMQVALLKELLAEKDKENARLNQELGALKQEIQKLQLSIKSSDTAQPLATTLPYLSISKASGKNSKRSIKK